MRKILAFLLAACLLVSAAPALALNNDDAALADNWYEIFVYSFADGNGDRIGDFVGLKEKLPYLQSLHVDGVWLMPIHPSPSYHKYDVTDYCAIDPQYGTLADFQAFLAAAHEAGIKVILDLVVNHTSSEHPWFQAARASADSPYRAYYNFSDTPKTGYNALPDGTYFESRFVSTMPDLNLDNPQVRAEIEEIMRFWLEMGVDGFRLDAVTSYYTGNKEKNISFLRWLNGAAKAIRPDCFIVGECWDSLYTIHDYYASGVDSFFAFPVAQGSGYIAKILGNDVEKKGESLGNVINLLQRELGEYVMTPFLGNHDTPRIINSLGASSPTNAKMACGLLSILNGSIFVYYGDEIGLAGTANDPNKRLGMFWDKKMNITLCPPGTTVADYPFPSVQEQDGNPLSILNYYRAALALRHQFPQIARGTPTVLESPDASLCLIEKDWQGDRILIAVNLSIDDLSFPLPGGYTQLAGELEIWGEAEVNGGEALVPSYGITIFQ